MGVSRGIPPSNQGYRFNPSLTALSTPLTARAAQGFLPALHDYAHKPSLSEQQQVLKTWADAIIDSSRLDGDRTIKASIPGEAGDVGAVYALDFYYRWKTGRSLEPGANRGAVEFTKLGQTLTSDFIRPPTPGDTKPCRVISVHLDPQPTRGFDFDHQRKIIIESLKAVPANPIEQLLAALVLKCRCPQRSPFSGIIRNSERGKGLLDTNLSGLKVVIISEDSNPIYYMSMSKPVAEGTRI